MSLFGSAPPAPRAPECARGRQRVPEGARGRQRAPEWKLHRDRGEGGQEDGGVQPGRPAQGEAVRQDCRRRKAMLQMAPDRRRLREVLGAWARSPARVMPGPPCGKVALPLFSTALRFLSRADVREPFKQIQLYTYVPAFTMTCDQTLCALVADVVVIAWFNVMWAFAQLGVASSMSWLSVPAPGGKSSRAARV